MNSQNTPIHSQNHIQTWNRSVHCRLALQTEPQGNQRCRNTWHTIEIDVIQTTTNIPDCMTVQQLQQATSQDHHLQQLKDYIIRGWPENKDQIPQDIQTYWTFHDYLAVIDGVILRDRYVVIHVLFKKKKKNNSTETKLE